VIVNLAAGDARGDGADSLVGIENVRGSSFDDKDCLGTQLDPTLTGTLESPRADFPGDPPGTIEVVLESIATADVFQ